MQNKADNSELSKQEIVNYYEKELNALQAELELCKKESLQSAQALQNVLNSKFWRVTKPLRGIKMLNNRKPKTMRQAAVQALPAVQDVVSFIIPVYNGGEDFVRLLNCLESQTLLAQKEIVIVDSGSVDGSVQAAQKHGVKLVQIPNEEFTHAYARNLGAQTATGKYLVYLTQDALPCGNAWARHLLQPLVLGTAVAASGMQVPRADADLYSKISLEAHNSYVGFTHGDRITVPSSAVDASKRRVDAHLDDVNCAVLRDVMLKFPHKIGFLEDLDLGLRLHDAGLPVALLGSVKVVHSHNRSLMYNAKRGYVDTIALNSLMPEFMENPGTAPDTLALLVNGHRQVTHVCDILRKVGQSHDKSAWQTEVLRLADNIPRVDLFEKHVPACSSGDKAFDKLMLAICEIQKNSPKAANNMRNRIMRYLKESLFYYINANCTNISDEFIEEAVGAFQKFFAVRVGVELASYTIFNDAAENSKLTELAQSLAGGV